MVMDAGRLFRHLAILPRAMHRAFDASTRAAIEEAIRAAESRHGGQICIAMETALAPAALLRAQLARERALEVFAGLRVWDTEHNNGVLIYLLLADRDVEIVADRGIDARVGAAAWEQVCRRMEAEFRAGAFRAGALAGIAAVSELLARHYPVADAHNELPDVPRFL
jgi:uncharacterized membrane protein